MERVYYTSLEGWKTRRIDKKMEKHWDKIAERPLSVNEEYQREWNFRETDYNHQPSNNGLDLMNPNFALDKKLTKYLRRKSCIIVGGKITDVRYED